MHIVKHTYTCDSNIFARSKKYSKILQHDSLAKQIRGKNIVTLSLFDFMVTQKPEKYTSIKHMCFFFKTFVFMLH